MIEKNIYRAGIMAIPIKDDNFEGPKPNFLVINNQDGWHRNGQFENPATGEFEKKACVNLYLSFSLRSTWDDGSLQEMEFPLKRVVEQLPVETLILLTSYDVLIAQEATVNAILNLFGFGGGSQLAGFSPVLDTVRAQEIADDIETRDTISEIIKQGFTYKSEVDDYLTANSLDHADLLEYDDYENYYNSLMESLPEESL